MQTEHSDEDTAKQTCHTLSGWRHSAWWTYGVMLIVSCIALGASFILSAETLALARRPHQALSCDVNAVVSCSRVATSWQAEFIRFGELSFPNAFFGIAAESVFITIAVIGLAGVRLPRWFAICTWLGGLLALLYAYWLFTQSVFVIRALCPWCLVLMFSTTIQFMALSHASFGIQGLASRMRMAHSYYRLHYDVMVNIVWIISLITLLVVKYGFAL